MTDKEILEDIKNRCEHDCYMDNKRSLSVSLSDILWLIDQTEKKQELEDLINTHAPHGRNYTNEQYVKLRLKSQQLEANLEDCLNRYADMEEEVNVKYRGFLAAIEEAVQYASLVEKYSEARLKIEQIYKDNYENYPNEYNGGYLDGLDRALGVLEDVEEGE